MRTGLRRLAAILGLAVAYFLAGKLGLSWAYLHESASPVWPPSGIALAALLLWGYRLWPGIFLGAFLVNITTQGSAVTTLGIAFGNTLASILGAWLINCFADGAKVFERARNIFRFLLLAGIFSTTISATLGVTSLTLSGLAQWHEYGGIWLTWWFGDMAGDLLLAPLVVIWVKQPHPNLRPGRVPEAAGLLLTSLLVAFIVFVAQSRSGLEHMAILPLLWAAFRFGQRGAVTAAFFMSAIALAGTLQGLGPFSIEDPNASLLRLQIFMATIAMAALVLAAISSEAVRAEQRLQVQGTISRTLAESQDLKQAGWKILQILCEKAGWSTGAIWAVDSVSNELACTEIWHLPSTDVAQFEAATRARRFAPGIGLPGRVWSSGNSVWISDVTKDGNFPRAAIAEKAGLHAAFGFPVKAGREIWGVIECFSRDVREPDDHFLQIVSDIGGQLGQFIDRKRAEEGALMLAAIVESSDDAIISKNLDGIITSWNTGAERLLGYRAEEIIGEPVLRIIPPERHNEEADLLEQLRRGESIEHYETARLTRDGRRIDVSLTVSPIRNGEGKIIGVSKIARDITDRKRAEELLAQARSDLLRGNAELERRVQERTADLEHANTALLKNFEEQKRLEEQLRQAQKMESIGTLAGGIAHDFNNVLNIIRGYATLASRQSSADQRIAESMKVINEEVDRGASVVRQLLTLARKTETLLIRTDVNQAILTVSKLIRQTFPKIIDVRLNLNPEAPPVMADPNQIEQVLLNISVNARDAMPNGGILSFTTDVVGRDELQRRHRDAEADLYVCIAVADTGTGMDERVRLRIFEPFFTTKPFGEGSGLGLAMVYALIKNHNGLIDVESDPGRGTTFRLYLPALRTEEISVSQETPVEPGALKQDKCRGTILIAEDEKAMSRLMENFLVRAGYRVIAAADGEAAIALYLRHKEQIGLVLVDLNLPKASGSEVIRKLKEQTPGLKIIVTSGYLEPEMKSELLQAGVSEYIQKPYAIDQVLEKFQSVYEGS